MPGCPESFATAAAPLTQDYPAVPSSAEARIEGSRRIEGRSVQASSFVLPRVAGRKDDWND